MKKEVKIASSELLLARPALSDKGQLNETLHDRKSVDCKISLGQCGHYECRQHDNLTDQLQ